MLLGPCGDLPNGEDTAANKVRCSESAISNNELSRGSILLSPWRHLPRPSRSSETGVITIVD